MSTTLRRVAALPALIAAATGLSLAAAPAEACGCGVALDAQVSSEAGLVIERPGAEQIILSLGLTSAPGDRAAVVVPVPGPQPPTVEAIRGGDPLAYLDRATAASEPDPAAGASEGSSSQARVEVLGKDEIGGYQVSRLRSSDPQALGEWLDRHGYTLPAGADPILSDYVDEGWNFVAIRLAKGATGTLKPLGISFATDGYVYPMRLEQLAIDPVDLTLYVVSPQGAAVVDGLATVWEGPVAELAPPPPAKLAPLFPEGAYLTRLETQAADPAQFSSDLTIGEVAPASAPGAPPTIADHADPIGGAGVALLIAAGAVFALILIVATRPRRG